MVRALASHQCGPGSIPRFSSDFFFLELTALAYVTSLMLIYIYIYIFMLMLPSQCKPGFNDYH